MHTSTQTSRAAASRSSAPLETMVLRSRLTPALRRLLASLGVHVEPIRWPGFIGPQLDYVRGAPPEPAPEWLAPAAADDLLQVLRQMEARGGTPDWVRQWLASDRAGTLLNGDGSLELGTPLPLHQLLGLPD